MNTWLCFNSASGFPFGNNIIQYSITRNAVELSAVASGSLKMRIKSVMTEASLLTNENQNAGCQRKDSHYDCRDGDVEQQSDSDKN